MLMTGSMDQTNFHLRALASTKSTERKAKAHIGYHRRGGSQVVSPQSKIKDEH